MSAPFEHYRSRREKATRTAGELEGRLSRASVARIVAFLVAAGSFLLLETSPRSSWPALIGVGLAATVVFGWLVRRHAGIRARLRRERLDATLAEEAVARLNRDWKAFPIPGLEAPPPSHASAPDLDLVGHASLAHLIGRVRTAPGRALLRGMILDPFAPLPTSGGELLDRLAGPDRDSVARPAPGWAEARTERQDAVRHLGPATEFRDGLELLVREVEGEGASAATRRFLHWLDGDRWLESHRRVLWLGRVLGVMIPVTLATWFVGWTPIALPLLGALVSLGLQRAVGSALAERAGAAEAGEGDLRRWTTLLEHAEGLPSGTPLLDRLGHAIREPAPGPAGALRTLLRITDTAGARRSALAHFPLVALFAWDVHMLDWLERWHRRHAAAAGDWIRATGEIEVLCALGGLHYDHPDWAFAEMGREAVGQRAIDRAAIDGAELAGPEPEGIHATALGHPLLSPARCVPNDVSVPRPGRLLLVTGSNMAGKTTLLRALGANQILALIGAPVAAKAFRTHPLLPWTAMRVRDDLESGVSYFLAELNRLRLVVEAARRGPVLYLLDEILQGTNSEERRVAARIVLGHLLETGALGAVTTHDLSLADSEHLRSRSENVHFREEVRETAGGKELNFDYRLRSGPATSRNALLLVDMVGLGPDGS